MPNELDPLTILNNAVEQCLIKSECVKSAMGLAVAKNFEAFNKTRVTNKNDTVGESDLPELILVPKGGPANLNAASNLVTFDLQFELGINTGSFQLNKFIFPIYWAVYATLCTALIQSTLTGLTWRGRSFCKNFSIEDTTLGMSNPEVRGIEGWTGLLKLTFNLAFDRVNVVAFAGTQAA